MVLLNVKTANEKKQIVVTSFTTDKKLYEYLPTTFNITVHNTGNVHVVAMGNIYISRDHKNNIAVIDVNPNLGNTLPDSSRVFSVTWSDGFPVYKKKTDNGQVISDKSGKPVMQLNYDFSKTNKLRFGKYYAHLTLIYDDGTKDVPIEAEVSFWVVPWGLILEAIAIPLIPSLIVYAIMSRRIKHQKSKIQKSPSNE